jgi:hypothetical protein
MLLKKQWLFGLMAVSVMSASTAAQAADPAPAGVIRISDKNGKQGQSAPGIQQSSHVRYRPVSPDSLINTPVHFAGQYVEQSSMYQSGAGCSTCSDGRYSRRDKWGRILRKISRKHNQYWNCKLGYFTPTGCGGGGCPPFGTYDLVYPVNPQHFDSRDGKLYSAQGHGVPMAVPLAPNVTHSYNYGWGIPSSRRTAISRPAPHIQYLNR